MFVLTRLGSPKGVAASAAASSASFWSLSFLNRAVFASRASVSASEIDRATEVVDCALLSLDGLNKESLVGIAIPSPLYPEHGPAASGRVFSGQCYAATESSTGFAAYTLKLQTGEAAPRGAG